MAEFSPARRFLAAHRERRRLKLSEAVADRIMMAVAVSSLLATLVAHHFGWA